MSVHFPFLIRDSVSASAVFFHFLLGCWAFPLCLPIWVVLSQLLFLLGMTLFGNTPLFGLIDLLSFLSASWGSASVSFAGFMVICITSVYG